MSLLFDLLLLSSLLAAADALTRDSSFDEVIAASFVGRNRNTSEGRCAPKPMNEVKACLRAYYANYEYDIEHMPFSKVFHNQLFMMMLNQSKDGVQHACKDSDALSTCLANVTDANTCMNTESFSAMLNVSEESSAGYVFDYSYLGYWCAHEKVLEDNFACMENPDDEHYNQRILCSNVFNLQVQSGVDDCVCASFLVSCLTMIDDDACGAELDKYKCEWTERLLLLLGAPCKGKLPDCSIFNSKHAVSKKPRISSRRPMKLSKADRYDVY